MMQRRKHMMSREKFISVLFRQQDSFVPIVINGDTPSPGISHEAPLPSPQPSVPFPLKGKDSSEISLELPNGLKLKFKGSSGCEAALNLISKIYNANVLPK